MSVNTKTQATLAGVKDLGHEVSAWEGRLLYLQNETGNLQRKNDSVKAEIESALKIAQQELDKKRTEAKVEMDKIREATGKLEADKEEFKSILSSFNKERNEFEKEKTKILDQAADTKKLYDKVSNFILLVKRESQSI